MYEGTEDEKEGSKISKIGQEAERFANDFYDPDSLDDTDKYHRLNRTFTKAMSQQLQESAVTNY